jgi:hypothetical protein
MLALKVLEDRTNHVRASRMTARFNQYAIDARPAARRRRA